MTRQIKMTNRIVRQIEQYVAITQTAHLLEQTATALVTNIMLTQLGAEVIAGALDIPLGTVIGG